ncbi:unnamed protein product [Dovyalis caffra]|uniref:Uncharacterized protein n=1 Tax=Dovyalis caffra TaxID=77055 RepID=A0AAV1S318_9ROSI|nr:unnamed protein product [Dovyalis caffra]
MVWGEFNWDLPEEWEGSCDLLGLFLFLPRYCPLPREGLKPRAVNYAVGGTESMGRLIVPVFGVKSARKLPAGVGLARRDLRATAGEISPGGKLLRVKHTGVWADLCDRATEKSIAGAAPSLKPAAPTGKVTFNPNLPKRVLLEQLKVLEHYQAVASSLRGHLPRAAAENIIGTNPSIRGPTPSYRP